MKLDLDPHYPYEMRNGELVTFSYRWSEERKELASRKSAREQELLALQSKPAHTSTPKGGGAPVSRQVVQTSAPVTITKTEPGPQAAAPEPAPVVKQEPFSPFRPLRRPWESRKAQEEQEEPPRWRPPGRRFPGL